MNGKIKNPQGLIPDGNKGKGTLFKNGKIKNPVRNNKELNGKEPRE
jgi:hypothetical protein